MDDGMVGVVVVGMVEVWMTFRYIGPRPYAGL